MRSCTQLVRLVGGSSGGIDWRTRLQAADLLNFCLARVRLSATAEKDVQLLGSIPSLMGELRASARPLIKALVAFANEEEPPDKASREQAEQFASVLRGIVGALWGLAAALRAAAKPLPASRELVGLCSKLLDLAPERGESFFMTMRIEKLANNHGAKFRTFALGLFAALEFESSTQPIVCACAPPVRARAREQSGSSVCVHA